MRLHACSEKKNLSPEGLSKEQPDTVEGKLRLTPAAREIFNNDGSVKDRHI